MTREQLIKQIRNKGSFLCVGLDPDPDKMPSHLRNDSTQVLEFCKGVIEATKHSCVAFKMNIAFFEALGTKGWDILFEVRACLPPECFLIADAKRADIGNTSRLYARAFFEELDFDAITVSPYMGEDSIRPFLDYPGKWTIVLALTSNPGAADFQMMQDSAGAFLYEKVLSSVTKWGTPENLMFVAGATRISYLKHVRSRVPDHFLLVPGVGAQGGDLNGVADACMTTDIGILVNSSRDILYASGEIDYTQAAGARAKAYQLAMEEILGRK